MNCPGCDAVMSYASQDARWWCNRCLAYRDGDAPADAPPPAQRTAHRGEGDGARLGSATAGFLDFGWLILLGVGIAVGIYLAS